MAGIQASIGLITGVPITDTVDQLIALQARPRDLLLARTHNLQNQQIAIGELTALSISVQLSATKLASGELFQQRTVASSNPDVLTATLTGSPPLGDFKFRPIRLAQTQQLVSQEFDSADAELGEGTVTIRQGGFVDASADLALLRGGEGISRGKIRITDRSGQSSVVDLRFAQSVDDVISAINADDSLQVRASTSGDSIQLTDTSGQQSSNLIVQEIGGGTTAADLGLDGINTDQNDAVGSGLVRLADPIKLRQLNDGTGVSLRSGVPELAITFSDGSTLDADIELNQDDTIGDLLTVLNEVDPGRLAARISDDGLRLELNDLTTGSGTFEVRSAAGGTVAKDLGINTSTSDGTLQGGRLLGGLKSVLLGSLRGGQGLGGLGTLDVTDRSGATAQIDLSGAETLEAVVQRINASEVGVQAEINQARNGFTISDTTGSAAQNLVISNGDATNSAEALGIAVNDSIGAVNSGSLDRQTYFEDLKLDQLNGGQGVQSGSFLITDSAGLQAAVNLTQLDADSVGDVIDEINSLGIGVEARINDTGDGLLLLDTAGGSGELNVEDSGNGTAAKDLKIAGTATDQDIGGTTRQAIDGSTAIKIDVQAGDTLGDLIERINESGGPLSANLLSTGADNPAFRLSIVSSNAGNDGALQIDTGELAFSFQELSPAQDALLQIGSPDSANGGLLISSSSNTFDQLVSGVNLSINGSSENTVTVTVGQTDDKFVAAVDLLVDQYNKLQDKLGELTFFNDTDKSTGILFGTNEALRIETELSDLFSGSFRGAGEIRSLETLGLSLDANGKLDLDKEKLSGQLATNREAVQEFFTTEDVGFAARVSDAIDSIAGAGNSLLINRTDALSRRIDQNNQRIENFNSRLDRQRERLLEKFFTLETAIGRLQSNASVVSSIQAVAPLVSV